MWVGSVNQTELNVTYLESNKVLVMWFKGRNPREIKKYSELNK
jgi:hypothetical protein